MIMYIFSLFFFLHYMYIYKQYKMQERRSKKYNKSSQLILIKIKIKQKQSKVKQSKVKQSKVKQSKVKVMFICHNFGAKVSELISQFTYNPNKVEFSMTIYNQLHQMYQENLQEVSFQYTIDRIRKDVKNSILATQLMNLLSDHKVYKQSRDCANILQISSTKKNTEIIAFRASYLSKVLVQTKGYTFASASDYICNYLRQNIVKKATQKYMKQGQNNPKELIQAADSVVSQKIQIFRKILKTDPTDQTIVKQLVSELYGHHPSKRKIIHKITGIFCSQRILKDSLLPSTHQPEDHFEAPEIRSEEPISRIGQEQQVLYRPILERDSQELSWVIQLTKQQRQRWRDVDFEEKNDSF